MADIEHDVVEVLARCSFCDKREAEVRRLIAGHSAFICDECVGLCLAVVGAGEAGDDVGERLIGVWGDFVARGQWTPAMMTGVLMQLAGGGQAPSDAGVDGLEATAFALNQVRRPPPPPDPDDVLSCGFCAKRGGETDRLNVGHAGRICGECVEKLLEVRALSDPAYRAQVIELLNGLADEP